MWFFIINVGVVGSNWKVLNHLCGIQIKPGQMYIYWLFTYFEKLYSVYYTWYKLSGWDITDCGWGLEWRSKVMDLGLAVQEVGGGEGISGGLW